MVLEFIIQLDHVSQLIITTLFMALSYVFLSSIRRITLMKFHINQIKNMSKIIENIEDIQDLNAKNILFKNNFISTLIKSYLSDFQNFLKIYILDQNILDQDINNKNRYFDLLHSKLYQKLENTLIKQTGHISMLSTLAQSTPLIGVLGTTWQLFYMLKVLKEIHISQIDIANSCLPLLIGLITSISSLILFNYLQKKQNLIEQDLIDLTDKFYWKTIFIIDNKLYNLNNNIFSNNLDYRQKQL